MCELLYGMISGVLISHLRFLVIYNMIIHIDMLGAVMKSLIAHSKKGILVVTIYRH